MAVLRNHLFTRNLFSHLVQYIVLSVVLLGVLSAAPATLWAQQADFEEATSLLDKGEYPVAIAIYDSIESQGFRSGALYLNTGVAYSGLNEQGIAKYFFLKAQRFPETEAEAAASLRYLEERFTHRSAVLPELPWERLLNTLSSVFGINGLFWVTMLFLYLAAAGWVGGFFLQTHWLRVLSVASVAMMIISLILAVAIYGQYQRYDVGVMTGDQAIVHASPAQDSEQISTAYRGYVMRIDWATSMAKKEGKVADSVEAMDGSASSDLWVFVRLQNGQQGWMPSSELMWFDPLDLR